MSWETVAKVGSRLSATIVVARLEAAGITAQIYADDFSGQLPFPLHGQSALVKVHPADAERARAWLALDAAAEEE